MKAKSFKKVLLFCSSFCFFCAHVNAQSVGVNTGSPQASLDVHGNFRVDSLPATTAIPIFAVVVDSAGFFSKQALPLGAETSVSATARKLETLLYTTDGF